MAVGWRRKASLKPRHIGETERGAASAAGTALIQVARI
jgi:hypothetical protein